MVNDAIADFLARLRNAAVLDKAYLELPYVKIIHVIARLIKEETGYFTEVKKFKEEAQERLRVNLAPAGSSARRFQVFQKLSKPGRRLYRSARQLRRLNHRDAFILISTSRGLMTTAKASKLSLGGELICELK